MTISGAFKNAIYILLNVCNKYNIQVVLMGGIAISFYVRPRATYDVDAIIDIEKEKNVFEKFLREIDKKGFDFNKRKPLKQIHDLSFLPLYYRKGKLYVDLFIAENEFQKGIIDRARKIRFGKMLLNVISPEDLILLKLLTGRQRDTDDVRNIICENLQSLDFEYINKWARRLKVKVFLDDEIKSLGIKM